MKPRARLSYVLSTLLAACGGTPTTVDHPRPMADIVQLATGLEHTCARLLDGDVWCWGDGTRSVPFEDGPRGPVPPTRVEGVSGTLDLDVGTHSACAVTEDRGVLCWGLDTHGGLGDGETGLGQRARRLATPVVGVREAAEVSVGAYFACARTQTGEVYCWGNGELGQLGDGRRRTMRVATRATVSGATQIESGHAHSCAVLADGTVQCWGSFRDDEGRNQGSGSDRLAPETVAGVAGATAIASGGGHTCAQTAGTIVCFGGGTSETRNFDERSGEALESHGVDLPLALEPTPLPGITPTSPERLPLAVSRDAAHVCVRAQTRHFDLSGDAPTPSSTVSVPCATLVSAGVGFVCAIRSGQVQCAGTNTHGELGTGDSEPREGAVAVGGL